MSPSLKLRQVSRSTRNQVLLNMFRDAYMANDKVEYGIPESIKLNTHVSIADCVVLPTYVVHEFTKCVDFFLLYIDFHLLGAGALLVGNDLPLQVKSFTLPSQLILSKL